MKAFGSILAFKSRSKFDHDFGMLFCRIPGRDAASTRRRRDCNAGPGAADPPWAAPLSRAEGSYKRLGSQVPRPKASQASQTRSNTPWARGPANFSGFWTFWKIGVSRIWLKNRVFRRGIRIFWLLWEVGQLPQNL